jgi:hypothetical protein
MFFRVRARVFLFQAVLELKNTSVYSPDAQFILFLAETAVHVEAYLTHAACLDMPGAATDEARLSNGLAARRRQLRRLRLALRALLHGPVAAVLDRWADEASAPPAGSPATTGGAASGKAHGAPAGDLPTLCVVHAYRALLYGNSTPGELALPADPAHWSAVFAATAAPGAASGAAGDSGSAAAAAAEGAAAAAAAEAALAGGAETVFARLLGSAAFVQNWHGFGLGQQRSDLLRCLSGDARDAEQRLLRFLQVGVWGHGEVLLRGGWRGMAHN